MTPPANRLRIFFSPLRWLRQTALLIPAGALAFGLPLARAAGETPVPATHPLVGTWSWPVFGGKCVETFQYRPNGTLLSTSGEAVTEWTYETSPVASDKGFYKVVETSLRQNGKKDCSGDVPDKDGDINVRYIQFSPALDRAIVCQSESLSACFGPLGKIP